MSDKASDYKTASYQRNKEIILNRAKNIIVITKKD